MMLACCFACWRLQLKADGRALMVRTLLDAGADWDTRDSSDRTAINRARSAAALHVLLEHVKSGSAGVSAVHDALRDQAVGGTPLHALLRDGYVRAAAVVLKTGRVDQQPGILNIMDADGYQPIYYAARHGNAAMVKLLFETGTDISKPNRKKQQLLHQLLELTDFTPEVLATVLERTADINERQHNGTLFSTMMRCC
jgi:ankyrin repeat protein